MATRRYLVRYETDATGDYDAVVPDIPRIWIASGDRKMAERDAILAIELHLADLAEDGIRPPLARATPLDDGFEYGYVTVTLPTAVKPKPTATIA